MVMVLKECIKSAKQAAFMSSAMSDVFAPGKKGWNLGRSEVVCNGRKA